MVITDYTISKLIYGTGWDGHIVVSATLNGAISIVTQNSPAKDSVP